MLSQSIDVSSSANKINHNDPTECCIQRLRNAGLPEPSLEKYAKLLSGKAYLGGEVTRGYYLEDFQEFVWFEVRLNEKGGWFREFLTENNSINVFRYMGCGAGITTIMKYLQYLENNYRGSIEEKSAFLKEQFSKFIEAGVRAQKRKKERQLKEAREGKEQVGPTEAVEARDPDEIGDVWLENLYQLSVKGIGLTECILWLYEAGKAGLLEPFLEELFNHLNHIKQRAITPEKQVAVVAWCIYWVCRWGHGQHITADFLKTLILMAGNNAAGPNAQGMHGACILWLQKAGKGELIDRFLERFIAAGPNAQGIANCIKELQEAGKGEELDRYLERFIAAGPNARGIANCIRELQEAGKGELIDRYLERFIDAGFDVQGIANCIKELQEAGKRELINAVLLESLIALGPYAGHTAYCIRELRLKRKEGLINTFLESFIDRGFDAQGIANGIQELQLAGKEGLINTFLIRATTARSKVWSISGCIRELREVGKEGLIDRFLEGCTTVGHDVESIVDCIKELRRVGKEGLIDTFLERCIDTGFDVRGITNCIKELGRVGKVGLIDTFLKRSTTAGLNARGIAVCIRVFREAGRRERIYALLESFIAADPAVQDIPDFIMGLQKAGRGGLINATFLERLIAAGPNVLGIIADCIRGLNKDPIGVDEEADRKRRIVEALLVSFIAADPAAQGIADCIMELRRADKRGLIDKAFVQGLIAAGPNAGRIANCIRWLQEAGKEELIDSLIAAGLNVLGIADCIMELQQAGKEELINAALLQKLIAAGPHAAGIVACFQKLRRENPELLYPFLKCLEALPHEQARALTRENLNHCLSVLSNYKKPSLWPAVITCVFSVVAATYVGILFLPALIIGLCFAAVVRKLSSIISRARFEKALRTFEASQDFSTQYPNTVQLGQESVVSWRQYVVSCSRRRVPLVEYEAYYQGYGKKVVAIATNDLVTRTTLQA